MPKVVGRAQEYIETSPDEYELYMKRLPNCSCGNCKVGCGTYCLCCFVLPCTLCCTPAFLDYEHPLGKMQYLNSNPEHFTVQEALKRELAKLIPKWIISVSDYLNQRASRNMKIDFFFINGVDLGASPDTMTLLEGLGKCQAISVSMENSNLNAI